MVEYIILIALGQKWWKLKAGDYQKKKKKQKKTKQLRLSILLLKRRLTFEKKFEGTKEERQILFKQ